MRDHCHRDRRRWTARHSRAAQRATRDVKLLSLSEGLTFCVRLRAAGDPRLEAELARWLTRARREGGLGNEDAALLGAAVVALDGAFEELAARIVERARGELFAPRARAARTPRAATRLAAITATALAVAGTGVINARGESLARGQASTTAKARVDRVAAPAGRCPVPRPLRPAFETASRKTGLPLALLVAVAHTESHFDGSALSGAGAVGVLQLMPETARALGADPDDPESNVLAGARYLRTLYSRFGSSRLAIAAYNAGPTLVSARAGHLDPGTTAYVARVQRTWRSLRGCR